MSNDELRLACSSVLRFSRVACSVLTFYVRVLDAMAGHMCTARDMFTNVERQMVFFFFLGLSFLCRDKDILTHVHESFKTIGIPPPS